ncbi:hypothetical protein PRZ48_014807 [Zasmidium cellare]|uniref:N-acetyltransferase domain-containing protein n=1 Tax=Zasmidium cellare TaxID=395010 RepID=A0ABR0DZC5_ZASCE|nr:hypothetical protein PRZ48_014807 [Zasmidium cellare]
MALRRSKRLAASTTPPPPRRSGRIRDIAERAARPRATIRINPALQQRRRDAAAAAAAAVAASPSPNRPTPAPAPAPDAAPGTPTPAATRVTRRTRRTVSPPEWMAWRQDFLQIQYGPQGRRRNRNLKCVVSVSQPPQGIYSRLQYHASFFLGNNKVATINAFRIDKTTTNAPNAEASWMGDFLNATRIENVRNERNGREVAKLLRACFRLDGVAKASVRAFRDEMTNEGVMIIDSVYVLDGYEGRGLMRPMLQMFRSGLQRLPEWFVFRGVLILSPARFEGELGSRWGDMSDSDVANTLRGMYERADNYQFCGNLPAWDETMIIMARMVED